MRRFGRWLCRHNWHDYSLFIEIGTITAPHKTIECCARCGKEATT